MLGAFAKAVEQIPDRRFLQVFLFGIIGAVAAMIVLWTAVGWALNQIAWEQIWLIGPIIEWMGTYAADLGWFSFALGAGGLTWLLFPVTAVAVISLFLESICEAVEHKHYPNRGEARSEPLLETVFNAMKFLGVTILVNLIALPIYLVLLIFLGTGAFVFIAVNGYLVSREFFELVAARRMGARSARRMRKAYQGRLWIFGIIAVFLMSFPILNLIVPVLAAAAMVHLYEGLPRKAEFEALDGKATSPGVPTRS